MRTGRPSNGPKLNRLRGNPGKRKIEELTFTPEEGEFLIPKGLSREVLEKCTNVAKYLQEAGVPIKFLGPRFDRYCLHSQIAYKTYKLLKKEGFIKNGERHPAVQIWKDNCKAALDLEQDFERVIKNTKYKPTTTDPMEEFLKGGKK